MLLFFLLLTKALDIKQCLLSAFHPQSNGQIKRINQILKHYLRCYTSDSQDNWADLLLLAMFTYNRRHHSSTKMSLFFANFGYNPSIVNPKMPTPHKDATNLLSKLKATQQVLFDNLNKSLLTYKKFANTKRAKGYEIKTDGWVMLNAKNLKFKHSIKKSSPKFVGPFLVVKEINKVAFKLPNNWKVHPVFHRSLLRPSIGDVPFNLSHPLVEPGHTYEVEQILRSCIVRGKTQYLVKWKNYTIKEALGKRKPITKIAKTWSRFSKPKTKLWGVMSLITSMMQVKFFLYFAASLWKED